MTEESRPPTPPPQLPIRTDRLVLRGFTTDDVDDVLAYRGRDDVARFLLHEPFTREDVEVRLREWSGPDEANEVLRLALEHDGRVVGDVLLMFRDAEQRQAELGWVLHPDVAGRGLATEAVRALLDVAFGHYGMHRVFADLDGRNERSKALCERLGLRQEMHALQNYWSKGEWTDTYRYAMLAEEYAVDSGRGPGPASRP